MDKLPPIPIPLAQRWREIRLRIVPIGVFLLTLLIAGRIWMYEISSPSLVGLDLDPDNSIDLTDFAALHNELAGP